ncbi:hypothetical protein [Nitrincola sp. MINF-07-Sa-05]|uniref:hypothetical protein n=1 Tax=Nitrincola salilacus TaxID=3400273 RepID=UPI0039184552
MNLMTFREDALLAVESVFAFSDFTRRAESLCDELEGDADLIQRYKKAWFEMEIVNGVALGEWEDDGRPLIWMEKWNAKYKEDALEVIHDLLLVVSGR